MLFYNVCQIAHVKTLDFGKLTGFIYFSGVITFCFFSLIHLKRMLPFAEYRYDAIYFILLILCFAWRRHCGLLCGPRFRQTQAGPHRQPPQDRRGRGGRRAGQHGRRLCADARLLAAVGQIQRHQHSGAAEALSGAAGHGRGGVGAGHSGDLFASSVKRQVGIKDYGTIFPGHGGILDRFDSVMFIAPFVCIAVRYFFYLL